MFAMCLVKDAPLVLLDEIDAFLDTDNVKLLTDFIRNYLDSQVLIISHKE